MTEPIERYTARIWNTFLSRDAEGTLAELQQWVEADREAVRAERGPPQGGSGDPWQGWSGTIPYGDGERDDVLARVRRMAPDALMAETSPDGGLTWAACDDDLAMRAFERALLERLGSMPVAPAPSPVPDMATAEEVADGIRSFLTDGSLGGEPFMDGAAAGPLRGDGGLPREAGGLTVSLPGGAEYVVTVVRSR